MNLKTMQKCLDNYAGYMEEIKNRTDVVARLYEKHLCGKSMTGYIETDIDLIYLQLRKITELVMFACVVANKSAGLTLNKTLRKGYELKKIKKELEKFNTDFFPTPKVEGTPINGIRKIDDLTKEQRAFLSEEELFTTYGVAGNFLHAQRKYQYGNNESKIRHLTKALIEINKITSLLNHHWTRISEDSFFAVIMKSVDDGKVHVTYITSDVDQ